MTVSLSPMLMTQVRKGGGRAPAMSKLEAAQDVLVPDPTASCIPDDRAKLQRSIGGPTFTRQDAFPGRPFSRRGRGGVGSDLLRYVLRNLDSGILHDSYVTQARWPPPRSRTR